MRVTKEAIFGAYYNLLFEYNSKCDSATGSCHEPIPSKEGDDSATDLGVLIEFQDLPRVVELSLFQDIRGYFSITRYSTKNDQLQTQNEDDLSILCYNLWNFNTPWATRRQIIADEVARLQPDIIGWQEARYRYLFRIYILII